MKNILNIIPILLFLLCIGCSDSESDKFEYENIRIDKTVGTFTANGGTGVILLGTTTPVEISSDQEWCKVSLSGKRINIEVQPNISKWGRTALITLKSGELTDYVPITQTCVLLNLDYKEINFNSTGGEVFIAYDCAVPITILNDAGWLEFNVLENTIICKAPIYTEMEEDRTATIKIQADGELITKEIVITQEKYALPYNYYLGEWEMSYTADRTSDKDVTRIVTIVEKVENETYELRGLDDLAVVLAYTNGKLNMITQSVLTDNDGNVLWLCPRSASSTTKTEGSGFTNKIDFESSRLAFDWVENGIWKPSSPPVTGFCFRYYNSGGSSTSNYHYFDPTPTSNRYRNILLPIRMEKVEQ